jgi:hypothetical protein
MGRESEKMKVEREGEEKEGRKERSQAAREGERKGKENIQLIRSGLVV